MTPLPKKKHSKSDSKTRRAATNLRLPSLIKCSSCNELRFPHRACPHCGAYKNEKPAAKPVAAA